MSYTHRFPSDIALTLGRLLPASFPWSGWRPCRVAVMILAVFAVQSAAAAPILDAAESQQSESGGIARDQESTKSVDPKSGVDGSTSRQATTDPKTASRPAQSKPPKSLDELLGVPSSGGSGSSAEGAAEREQTRRLERALEEGSLEDLVDRAVGGMRSAAERLEDARDPGIGTQRIQEDVVRTLARLLEEAERQSQSKSKSSSSRRSGSRRSANEDPSEANGQQASQRDARSSQVAGKPQSGDGDGESTLDRQTDQATVDAIELEESRIEWGQLPERVRELVLQGRRDRVSSIYERLTREYYRRLAEEASK